MMNIDEMPAGREMDALIEKYVFNKNPQYGCFADDTYNGECVGADGATDCLLAEQKLRKQKQIPGDCKYWRTVEPEPYSTDIAAAWEVVEGARNTPCKDGDHYCFDLYAENTWRAIFHHHLRVDDNPDEWEKQFEWFEAGANTAPLAICRAALKAVGASQ